METLRFIIGEEYAKNVRITFKRWFHCHSATYAPFSARHPKIILLSNRLPFVLSKQSDGTLVRKPSAGGLVTAVAPVIIAGDGYWVGWPGPVFKPGMKIPESAPFDKSPTAGLKSEKIVPVVLDEQHFHLYYNGCCNDTFWPLLHSMPDRSKFSADYWHAYEIANQIFSEKAIEALENYKKDKNKQDVIIWVHDYHLMLASNIIRKTGRHQNLEFKLAFFMHVPFPSWDLFRLYPWGDMVLQGLLGSDLVGFHTAHYCRNFINCCRRLLGCRVDYNKLLVEHGGRTIKVESLPIGIPYDSFEKLAHSSKKIITDKHRIILGVDRLDYTKGLVYKLKAFRLFLTKYPQYIEKVVFIQIAVPSRTDVKIYKFLKQELDELVGRINGQFTTANWTPIRYIYGMHSQENLASLYRDSDVAFIAPLRDGMNLVAKEFVACQIAKPGVLIISPFAGASETMKEALVANPSEPLECAETLHRALSMTEDERTVRMNYLKQREKERCVDYWMRSFLDHMEHVAHATHGNDEILDPITEAMLDFELKTHQKELNPNVAILLDYDGTLAPLAFKPELAVLPTVTRHQLERLAEMPNVTLGIISGRLIQNVMKMVNIKNVVYSGSHGQDIIFPNGDHFAEHVPEDILNKAKSIMKEIQEKICVDGAWLEDKGAHLSYHYRPVPREKYLKLSMEAIDIITKGGFVARRAHKAVEAKPPVDWHKGTACMHILTKIFGHNWYKNVTIFYIGDDVTDEDAMLTLKGMAHTYRVAKGEYIRTNAEKRLPTSENVLVLLNWIEKQYSKLLQAKK